MMRKLKRPNRAPSGNSADRGAGRQSAGNVASHNDREELDTDFDTVDIDDVVRQARNGRIDIAELDAF